MVLALAAAAEVAPKARAFNADFAVDVSDALIELQGIAERAVDMRPAFRQVRDLMMDAHRKNWSSRGRHLGEPWPGLAASTLERKSRAGLPSEPLTATGALERAIHGGRGKVTSVTRTSARVGVRLFYARFHMAQSNRMPRRRVVGIDRQTERAALGIIQRHLLEGR